MTNRQDIWQCECCGTMQGRHDMYFDGICADCHSTQQTEIDDAEFSEHLKSLAPQMLEMLKEAIDQLESFNLESEDTFTMKRIKELLAKIYNNHSHK